MTIKIEKNVPIPEKGKRSLSGISDVMRDMEIGDSFSTDPSKRPNLFSIAKKLGIKISTRLEEGDLRVWRVEEEKEEI